MKILRRQTIVSGLVIGRICTLFNDEERKIPRYSISESLVENEIERFTKGLNRAQDQLQKYIEESYQNLDGNASKIFYSWTI